MLRSAQVIICEVVEVTPMYFFVKMHVFLLNYMYTNVCRLLHRLASMCTHICRDETLLRKWTGVLNAALYVYDCLSWTSCSPHHLDPLQWRAALLVWKQPAKTRLEGAIQVFATVELFLILVYLLDKRKILCCGIQRVLWISIVYHMKRKLSCLALCS